jgi:hypothetical protein
MRWTRILVWELIHDLTFASHHSDKLVMQYETIVEFDGSFAIPPV